MPCPKNYNQTRLGLKFQIKRKPYKKRILITTENIKLSPITDRDTAMNQSATSALFFKVMGRLPVYSHRQNIGIGHRHEYITTSRLGHIRLFPIGSHLYRQLSCRLVTTAPSADLYPINSRCVSKDMCPKMVSTPRPAADATSFYLTFRLTVEQVAIIGTLQEECGFLTFY